MNQSTRQRLIEAASALFAERGYSGASVRDICNLARVNPGAVSYHFGGKRQLYRTALRQAAQRLARGEAQGSGEAPSPSPGVEAVLRQVFRRLGEAPVATRLLLRDLAEGGGLAVEALEPTLRGAVDALRAATGQTDEPGASAELRLLFLELAAPMFLLAAAWPAIARTLELADPERERLLDELTRRALARSAYASSSTL
jgi:AcrR family transcriptional regulator